MKRVAVVLAISIFSLAFASSAQAKPGGLDVELTALTKSQKVGERWCVQGLVTDRRGRPVGQARIQLDARITRTVKRGTFKLCQKLYYAGFHTAFASKGKDRGHGKIRLGKGAPQGAGDWRGVWIEFDSRQYPVYHDGRCSTSGFIVTSVDDFGVDTGNCYGNVNGKFPGPYGGRQAQIDWKEAGGPRVRLDIYTRKNDAQNPFTQLIGFMPSRGSDQLVISDSKGWVPNAVVGGSDTSRTGEPGGPLKVKVTADFYLGQLNGYTFQIHGWVLEK